MNSQPSIIKIMPDFGGYASDQLGRPVQIAHCFQHHPNHHEISAIEQELKRLAQHLSFSLLQGRQVIWREHEDSSLELAKRLAWAIGLIEIPILYSSHYCNRERLCQQVIDVTLTTDQVRRNLCPTCPVTSHVLNA